jgi:hypothetical protein
LFCSPVGGVDAGVGEEAEQRCPLSVQVRHELAVLVVGVSVVGEHLDLLGEIGDYGRPLPGVEVQRIERLGEDGPRPLRLHYDCRLRIRLVSNSASAHSVQCSCTLIAAYFVVVGTALFHEHLPSAAAPLAFRVASLAMIMTGLSGLAFGKEVEFKRNLERTARAGLEEAATPAPSLRMRGSLGGEDDPVVQ